MYIYMYMRRLDQRKPGKNTCVRQPCHVPFSRFFAYRNDLLLCYHCYRKPLLLYCVWFQVGSDSILHWTCCQIPSFELLSKHLRLIQSWAPHLIWCAPNLLQLAASTVISVGVGVCGGGGGGVCVYCMGRVDAFVNICKWGHTLLNKQANVDTPPTMDFLGVYYAKKITNSVKPSLKWVHLCRNINNLLLDG